MRRTLMLTVAVLAMLTAGQGRAQANGILVVPLEVYKWVPVAAAQTPAATGEWRLYSDGVWRYVWYAAPAPQYQWVKVSAYAIVPNPIRPCYRPPPPPSKAAPTASPQAPQAAPQASPPPDAKDAHEGHEHGVEMPKEGCGACFPECFLKLPCTCCAHDVEVLPALSPAALYYWNAVDKQVIAFRIISSYKQNADGTYTFEP
ncbi:hypothetical protein [Paludisphaera soli]|uniref:hypothetical protein n=1 Tax=Paludisphaera soli TaxID=2712865 RepID=UPI0013ED8E07|nr:hypothetical protein [Paludisphaera soli]